MLAKTTVGCQVIIRCFLTIKVFISIGFTR